MAEQDTYRVLEGDALEAAKDLNSITTVEEPALEERKKKAKAVLANVLTDPGWKAGGADNKPLVTVRRGSSSFSAEKAQQNLPDHLYADICEDVPDLSRAATVLTPAEYASICVMQPDEGLAKATLSPERYALLCDKRPSASMAEQLLPPALLEKCKEVAPPVIQAEPTKKGKR